MKKHFFILPVFFAVVLLTAMSCDQFPTVNLDDFQTIPLLENLNFDQVRPAVAYDYWELRFAFGGEDTFSVIGNSGVTNLTQIPNHIMQAFAGTRSTSGFDVECLPGYCFKYIASIRGSQIDLWNTAEDLVAFLGLIDSSADAILLATADGYSWEGIIEGGAMRKIPDGYQFIAQRLVDDCDPVQTDRFLFNISATGSITILGSEIWTKLDGACI